MSRLRSFLLIILVLGLAGTAAELVLAKHYDGAWQIAPLGLFGAAVVSLIARAAWSRPATLHAFRAVMVLFVASGGIGTFLHYRGKAEFALERNKSLAGWSLVREAVLKGTNPPLLAPGAMAMLGLIGIAWAMGPSQPSGSRK